jgi:uncharacterized protein YjbI with pentapeptide repeats
MRQVPSRVGAWVRRQQRTLLIAAGIVALAVTLVTPFWALDPVNYPATQAARFRATATALNDPGRVTLERDLLQYQTDSLIKIWAIIVQAGAGLITLGGIYFVWQNLRETRRKIDADRDATEERLAVDREGQVTNRFTQAIGQLGAELKDGRPNLEVRLGGIYALDRIAKDSARDYWPIIEVLTAYVRGNAPWPPHADASTSPADVSLPGEVETQAPVRVRARMRADIEAIVRVLRRRIPPEAQGEPAALELIATDLPRVDFSGAPLQGAYFRRARLVRAFFIGARLEGASFAGADLRDATFDDARLERAIFAGAQLEHARFRSAYLDRATFHEARLDGARFDGAQLPDAFLADAYLQGASFLTAHLERASFDHARLEGAAFNSAHLEGATFSRAWLQDADFRLSSLQGGDFSDARLEAADFTGAHLARASFSYADLERANFRLAHDLTPEQILNGRDHGKGAQLPDEWTAAQRETVWARWPGSVDVWKQQWEEAAHKGSGPPTVAQEEARLTEEQTRAGDGETATTSGQHSTTTPPATPPQADGVGTSPQAHTQPETPPTSA